MSISHDNNLYFCLSLRVCPFSLFFLSFFDAGLRSLQDLMPFCSDFYKNGFGHELFSDCVKEYFINASTISTEPFQAHAHNQVPGAQPTVLTSHTERELSPRVWASAAQTGESEEGPSIQAGSPPSPSSSLSVLAPGDNNLNRLRVPNISSGR